MTVHGFKHACQEKKEGSSSQGARAAGERGACSAARCCERPMSTSSTTELCTCACKQRRAPLPYTPGSSIFAKIVTGKRGRSRGAGGGRGSEHGAPRLPDEVVQAILAIMVARNDGLSVLKLSMLNRHYRRMVAEDWKSLYALYNRCMTSIARLSFLDTLPNFRRRSHSQWIRKEIRDNTCPERRPLYQRYIRRIVALKYNRACGMCGTSRYIVTPFWSLGKSLCKFCVQDNFVSDAWLYETCFFTYTEAWAGQIRGKVMYFREHTTTRTRTEFCLDALAYKGRQPSFNYYFWRPHLERVMDLPRMQAEGLEKLAAARVIRAAARRSIVMHKMSRMRGLTLKDKRPIHARLTAWDRMGTPFSLLQTMFHNQKVIEQMQLGEDYVHEDWAQALAAGRLRV